MAQQAPEYQDSSPEHIFVRFYPARLRRIIHEKRITMAQLGVLTILALRINENNQTFPSIARLANDACVSERSIWIALNKLKKLGVISWHVGGGKGKTNLYYLPDAFGYGANPDQKISETTNPDQKITPNPDQKITPNPDQKITPNPDQKITRSISNQEQPKEVEPTQDKTVFSSTEKAERETRHWRLKQEGVKEPEASLIAYQYSLELIDHAIQSVRTKQTQKPGAYIRTICERQEGPIQYNTNQITPPLPVAPPEPRNPYLADPYFSRHTDPDETQEYIPADIGD